MPVKTVEITSIDARRFTKPGEKINNVRIDNNSSVTLITPMNDEEANVEFRYTASYGGIGSIRMEGVIIYTGNVKDLATKWINEGNMPDEIAGEIHTAIMRVCVPEAIIISKDIKLPPPIPLPNINFKKNKTKKSSGMEVA
ncbi:MAG: hypothetical protein QGH39_09340 [Candidatus Thermoplasmatota archaeon]|nr:hypothetical protein [Candidatus Thermoplasmatota archaeon]